jgi:hypothetical protein
MRMIRSRHGEHDSAIMTSAGDFGQPDPIVPYPLGATFGIHNE